MNKFIIFSFIIVSFTVVNRSYADIRKSSFVGMSCPFFYVTNLNQSQIDSACSSCGGTPVENFRGCRDSSNVKRAIQYHQFNEAEYFNYLIATPEFQEMAHNALEKCSSNLFAIDSFSKSGSGFTGTSCNQEQAYNEAYDQITALEGSSFTDNLENNFLKSIITDPDSLTGEFTETSISPNQALINTLAELEKGGESYEYVCDSSVCRFDSVSASSLPAESQNLSNMQCATKSDTTYVVCKNVPEALNDPQAKLYPVNDTKDVYTTTSTVPPTATVVNVSNFTSPTGGGDNPDPNPNPGPNPNPDPSGKGISKQDVKDAINESDMIKKSDLTISDNKKINESNTPTFEATMESFNARILEGDNFISKVSNFSVPNLSGSKPNPVTFNLSGVGMGNITMSSHIDIFEQVAPIFEIIMKISWSICALYIIMKL